MMRRLSLGRDRHRQLFMASRVLAAFRVAAMGVAVMGLAVMVRATGPLAAQELRGHGGPVRAIVVTPDGQTAVTGSFDQTIIRWRLTEGTAEAVLRFHQEAVDALLVLPDGRVASGGGDGRIAIWGEGREPRQVLEGHQGPVAALAATPDGRALVSAGWDGTVRVHPLADGAARVLTGHAGPVAAVTVLPDGTLVSAGHDATLRFWPADDGTARIVTLESPLSGLRAAPDGEIVAAGADGRLRFFGPDGTPRAAMAVAPTPLVALALAPDGARVAAGGLRGDVVIVERASRRVAATLIGPGLPVWSLAFTPDGRQILSGGADRLVRRWDAQTGRHLGAVVPERGADPLAGLTGDPGAEVFRACAACHTLTPDGGNRAGPTLHGLFGRRIASVPGYDYSPALRGMDIVWTRETVARLFEIGPAAYTPGTRMPEQTVPDPAKREALMDFLEKATAPR